MLRTLLFTFIAMAVGYGILALLADGLLKGFFARTAVRLLKAAGMTGEEAAAWYSSAAAAEKPYIILACFILLFLIFFYFAISQVTNYLEEIGNEVTNILNESEGPVVLEPELRPIAERLTSLKMTLRRRELAANESEQKKNDLVVFLAHDLKTPLTSIIAYLTMLDEQPEMPAEDRTKYTRIALEKAIRLGELISEFFEITKFNLQDIVVEKEQLDLTLMLEQLADESYAVLSGKTLTCTVQAEEELIVDGDPDKLARVFDNLLRNAVAYSYPGTNIEIQAVREQNMIRVAFTNQGDPIPQQKLASIFEKFYRGDNSRSSQTGGSGLGLSIAREIVELHGGTIEASSQGYSNCFTVRLPMHKEEAAAQKRKGILR